MPDSTRSIVGGKLQVSAASPHLGVEHAFSAVGDVPVTSGRRRPNTAVNAHHVGEDNDGRVKRAVLDLDLFRHDLKDRRSGPATSERVDEAEVFQRHLVRRQVQARTLRGRVARARSGRGVNGDRSGRPAVTLQVDMAAVVVGNSAVLVRGIGGGSANGVSTGLQEEAHVALLGRGDDSPKTRRVRRVVHHALQSVGTSRVPCALRGEDGLPLRGVVSDVGEDEVVGARLASGHLAVVPDEVSPHARAENEFARVPEEQRQVLDHQLLHAQDIRLHGRGQSGGRVVSVASTSDGVAHARGVGGVTQGLAVSDQPRVSEIGRRRRGCAVLSELVRDSRARVTDHGASHPLLLISPGVVLADLELPRGSVPHHGPVDHAISGVARGVPVGLDEPVRRGVGRARRRAAQVNHVVRRNNGVSRGPVVSAQEEARLVTSPEARISGGRQGRDSRESSLKRGSALGLIEGDVHLAANSRLPNLRRRQVRVYGFVNLGEHSLGVDEAEDGAAPNDRKGQAHGGQVEVGVERKLEAVHPDVPGEEVDRGGPKGHRPPPSPVAASGRAVDEVVVRRAHGTGRVRPSFDGLSEERRALLVELIIDEDTPLLVNNQCVVLGLVKGVARDVSH